MNRCAFCGYPSKSARVVQTIDVGIDAIKPMLCVQCIRAVVAHSHRKKQEVRS